MKFKKIKIKRDVEGLIEDMENIIQSSSNEYQDRVWQFLNRINNSDILKSIIGPYFVIEIPEGQGFYNSRFGNRIEYKVPINDDEEIAAVLCLFKDYSVKVNQLNNIAFYIYYGKRFDDNINKLNYNIVLPAFNKLKRKLQYKLEDLDELEVTEFEEHDIKIININSITNSNISLGNNNIQTIESNNLDDVILELKNITSISNEQKILIIDFLNEIKNKKMSKIDFANGFIDIIVKMINVITIIKPYLIKVFALI